MMTGQETWIFDKMLLNMISETKLQSIVVSTFLPWEAVSSHNSNIKYAPRLLIVSMKFLVSALLFLQAATSADGANIREDRYVGGLRKGVESVVQHLIGEVSNS